MKIVIIGAGGVGGYFGGKLAQSGNKVSFIVRGNTLRAISENGLQVKSINGDFRVYPNATNNFDAVKNADLIVLGIKSWQIIDVAKLIKPHLNANCMVLPLQNGADNVDKLVSILNQKNVIAGLCKIVSKIEAPGIINHFGYEPEIIFGELTNEVTERITKLKTIFDKANFSNTLSKDIHVDIWKKFLFITTISGIGALTRSVMGEIRENKYLRLKMMNTAKEILKIANKKGIALTRTDIEKTFITIDKLDYNTTSSLQRDIMEGKPSELNNFNGFIVDKGLELNVDTPVNSFIYNCLLPLENKARKRKNST
jgi:2-dehydropantoate 2-reductase